MLDVQEVTINFEVAAIRPLKSCFSNAKIKAAFSILHRVCVKNFKISDWRKNTGKTQLYELYSITFVAFALIPKEHIFLGFQKLKEPTAWMQIEKVQRL